ncbi:hypothetical protein ACIPLC_26825 [Kitasatospora sp. NPDC086801]|uniref:hypothetical protein n=1 Tax=Kitasatospora sp. NPDC086801 TaxID=3364066 RepID=UPI003806F7A9
MLRELVEMTEGQGCDERVLELLAPIAEEFRRDPQQCRFDDAIQAVEHTFDDLYDGNLLQATMMLLAEQGRHDKALALIEGRSPEFLAENDAFWHVHLPRVLKPAST